MSERIDPNDHEHIQAPEDEKGKPKPKPDSFRDDREDHFGNNAGGHEALEDD